METEHEVEVFKWEDGTYRIDASELARAAQAARDAGAHEFSIKVPVAGISEAKARERGEICAWVGVGLGLGVTTVLLWSDPGLATMPWVLAGGCSAAFGYAIYLACRHFELGWGDLARRAGQAPGVVWNAVKGW
jgi:hypothetical protein